MRGFGAMLTMCWLILLGHILALAEVKTCDAGEVCNATDQAALVQSRIRHRREMEGLGPDDPVAVDRSQELPIRLKAPVFAFLAVTKLQDVATSASEMAGTVRSSAILSLQKTDSPPKSSMFSHLTSNP